jgi:hypothetical protein
VSCVVTIVSAYQDGKTTLGRIKAKREARGRPLDLRSIQDLESSLVLGPAIVQGQYDSDFRRFGQRYAQGDSMARESLKDIIINLHLTLLTNLQVASTDDDDLDLSALRNASDNCRVDAVMTLCQLYQRMSMEASMPTEPIPIAIGSAEIDPNRNQPLSYGISSNFGRQLSPQTYRRPNCHRHSNSEPHSPPTPSSMSSSHSSKKFNPLSWRGSSQRQSRNPDEKVNTPLTPSSESGESYSGPGGAPLRIPTPGEVQELPGDDVPTSLLAAVQSVKGQERGPSATGVQSDSEEITHSRTRYWLNNALSRGETSLGPSGYQILSGDSLSPGNSPSSASTWSPRDQGGRSCVLDGWRGRDREDNSPGSLSSPIQGPPSVTSADSCTSSTQAPNTTAVDIFLPSKANNFAGFCKGAWKLQTGMKKAFETYVRPTGLFNDKPYWRCCKCLYEGPVWGKSSSKSSWTYDNRVRTHAATGIRYRWSFLAKSHVYSRVIPESQDGSDGSFGCIFCCVQQRASAPIFGTLDSFMQHLLQHRESPSEMELLLYRVHYIVGRVAPLSEKFDVNIPPRLVELA